MVVHIDQLTVSRCHRCQRFEPQLINTERVARHSHSFHPRFESSLHARRVSSSTSRRRAPSALRRRLGRSADGSMSMNGTAGNSTTPVVVDDSDPSVRYGLNWVVTIPDDAAHNTYVCTPCLAFRYLADSDDCKYSPHHMQ